MNNLSKYCFCLVILFACHCNTVEQSQDRLTINRKADGYQGVWYSNQRLENKYNYKYSGGLGTYCAKHRPFAIYCKNVDKTFFCYGGTEPGSYRRYKDRMDSPKGMLLHMVSYYDHKTGMVPRPTILLDKRTNDAHDNPIISIDEQGYIWIFSTSHGTSRPSYIHRSSDPYNIDKFELVPATIQKKNEILPLDNFSYMQVWHIGEKGFISFFTKYGDPVERTTFFMSSPNGIQWSNLTRIGAIDRGHYQVSAAIASKAGTAFNFHPRETGLNWRSNIYYLETTDMGKSWQTADGTKLTLPLTDINNPALVHDYYSDSLNVYIKDLYYDKNGYPVILYITSKGYEAGPKNDPRIWTIAHWNGTHWKISEITTSDNNYDMGSLFYDGNNEWRLIAPTETGPQPYNPGGEIVMWRNQGLDAQWDKMKQLTFNSTFNHTYVRRPINAHPEFYALWADGNGREPSESRLYFCTKEGNVFMLPFDMKADFEKPIQIPIK
jgi:hypothetical protein